MDVSKFYRKAAYEHYIKNNDDPQIVEEKKSKSVLFFMIFLAVIIINFCIYLFLNLPKLEIYKVQCNGLSAEVKLEQKNISQIFIKKGKELSLINNIEIKISNDNSILILPSEFNSKCKVPNKDNINAELIIISK